MSAGSLARPLAAAACALMMGCQAPKPPSNLTAQRVNGGVLLTWNDPNAALLGKLRVRDAEQDISDDIAARNSYYVATPLPGKHEYSLSFPPMDGVSVPRTTFEFEPTKSFRPVEGNDLGLAEQSPLKDISILFTHLWLPAPGTGVGLTNDLGKVAFDPGALFRNMAGEILGSCFRSCYLVEPGEYPIIEANRRKLSREKQLAGQLRAQALLTIAFRPPRVDGLPPQLAISLYDLTADYGDELKPSTGRCLIYEGFAELESTTKLSELPGALVDAWRLLLHEMACSSRVNAFVASPAGVAVDQKAAGDRSALKRALIGTKASLPTGAEQDREVEQKILFARDEVVPEAAPSPAPVPPVEPQKDEPQPRPTDGTDVKPGGSPSGDGQG
ncbi:MAG: hypothetical protein U1E76_20545 [Planctomycetota bacterium]